MTLKPTAASLPALAGGVFALLIPASGQDSGRVDAPKPPAASAPGNDVLNTPAGSPVPGRQAPGSPAPGSPAPATGFARQDGTPAMRAVPAQPVVANPVQPANAPKPLGPSVSSMQSRSRVIEDARPERVQVYPDDPESAWWEINPHYAFARAQREQKPLMLLFTGMWNTQAMSLSGEVFSTKSFNEYVKENLVICYLNYPRNFTDAPDALRRIKEKFKVRGYPNVLIFNPNGEVERGIRGYRSGRPVDYFHELKNTCHPVLESIKAQKTELLHYGYRDWSNFRGKVIFARFVDRDATRARLQDVSGEKWIIKINDLAPSDQKLVESFPARESVEPVEEKK